MNYEVDIPGLSNKLEVENSFWKGTKLLFGGQHLEKGPKRGTFRLNLDSGEEVIVKFVNTFLDIPKLDVNGTVIKVVEPLKWYQWVWSALPVVIVFGGGALGALFGLIAVQVNLRVFRSGLEGFAKYLVAGAVSAAAVVIYFVLALAIRSALS